MEMPWHLNDQMLKVNFVLFVCFVLFCFVLFCLFVCLFVCLSLHLECVKSLHAVTACTIHTLFSVHLCGDVFVVYRQMGVQCLRR